MFCINCGRDVPDGNKYCIYCGVWMDAPEEPVTAAQPAVQTNEQPLFVQPAQQSLTPDAQIQTVQQPAQTYAFKAAENTVTANTYPLQKRKKKSKAPIILLSALIVVVALVVAVSVILGGGESDGEEDGIRVESTMQAPAAMENPETTASPPLTPYPQGNPGTVYSEPPTTPSYSQPPLSEPPYTQQSGNNMHTTNVSGGAGKPAAGNYAQICQTYNDKINDFRFYMWPVTLEKSETVDLHIADDYKGPDMLKNTFNSIFGMLTEPSVSTYNFTDAVDENGVALSERTMPWGRDACVSPSDISYANVYDNSDGGYTIELRFVSEYSYYDGNSMTEPIHHQSAMDPLNFGTLDISPLEISSADTYYPGAVIKLTVDAQGRLSHLNCNIPMEVTCTAGMGFVNGEISLEGSMDTTYNITYQY